MRKHCKKKTNHRVVLAVIAMLLCAFFLLPVLAKKNASVPAAASTSNNNNIMSDGVAMALSRMLGTAELIVWGDVKTVSDSSFVFSVSKRLSGNCKDATIEVLKVIPDRFASVLPPPYQKGQSYILFLTRPKNVQKNREWKVMGNGGEGQMPVERGYVYFQGNNINGLEFADYFVHGAKLYVQRFEFPSFLNAVEEYGKCFKWSRITNSKSLIPEKICTDAQIAEYSRKSFIHNYLAIQTQLMVPEK